MTVNRAFKHVSDLWRSRTEGLRNSNIHEPTDFVQDMGTLLFNQSVALDKYGATPEQIRNKEDPKNIWASDVRKLEARYQELYARYARILDEERYVLSIERKANTMAVFYRFLSTIAVGLGIMGIYWLAHYLGIPMPLMRVPI